MQKNMSNKSDKMYNTLGICIGQSRNYIKGSRSTFKFPSRVNLSGPSLYCTQLYGQDQQQGERGQTLSFI